MKFCPYNNRFDIFTSIPLSWVDWSKRQVKVHTHASSCKQHMRQRFRESNTTDGPIFLPCEIDGLCETNRDCCSRASEMGLKVQKTGISVENVPTRTCSLSRRRLGRRAPGPGVSLSISLSHEQKLNKLNFTGNQTNQGIKKHTNKRANQEAHTQNCRHASRQTRARAMDSRCRMPNPFV